MVKIWYFFSFLNFYVVGSAEIRFFWDHPRVAWTHLHPKICSFFMVFKIWFNFLLSTLCTCNVHIANITIQSVIFRQIRLIWKLRLRNIFLELFQDQNHLNSQQFQKASQRDSSRNQFPRFWKQHCIHTLIVLCSK